ncbi:60S ribosomal protein L14 [Theileria orientalis strain Shintoku]|uniref:60S ribosomal protein L14 n=1 Tax=Theileria orientalis strain Shintoku TaxID=869250 RepID=J4CCD7_THEOR|nr:60S ribosomal protein L14 [Theileria orientalis strain Shintoku]PVC50728.1 60S ribosomal protein L14 [Theileria orientalis]BAM39212.1 60S ribosomal protein L14 [Theileria orientalis strain Shintoku]|eukprot:XP_009689513.1 60S ribosomal protein L14 [Theileria orientalis strain Shintoku]
MPLFKKFVEPGRLCLLTYGPNSGKLVFVVDVVTPSRILVDGADVTGVKRQQVPKTWLKLTDVKVDLQRGAKTKTVSKVAKAEKALELFDKTSLGKKLRVVEKKKNLNDFQRFKLMVAQRQRRKLLKL